MGAKNAIRVLTEAGLNGELLDLGANGILRVIPNQTNTHSVHIGNGTNDMDFRVYLGAANTYFELDVANSSMNLNNVSLTLGSSVSATSLTTVDMTVTNTLTVTSLAATTFNVSGTGTYSALIAGTGTISGLTTSGTLNTGALNVSGTAAANVVTAANLTATGALTAGTLSVTGTLTGGAITGTALTVIPTVDDTGIFQIGDATKGMDFKVTMANASKYFLLDRGATQMTILGLPWTTDSPMVVNSTITTDNTLTAATVNTATMNLTGKTTFSGSGYFSQKQVNVTGNTPITAAHYGSVVQSTGVSKTITLPSPTGLEGTWLEVMSYNTSTTTIQCVNATSQLLTVSGQQVANTVALNNWAEAIRATCLGDRWVISPYEGTTVVVT